MARKKSASKSSDSEHGSRSRQKQSETKIETIVKVTHPNSNAESMSSTVSSRNFNIEYPKSPQGDMNPPIIFNSTGSSKYLHKKFKRIATVNEECCDKSTPNSNGESISDIGQLQHINKQCQKRLTNNSNPFEISNREISVNCAHCHCPIHVEQRSNKGSNEGNSCLCVECLTVDSNISEALVQPSRSVVIDETDAISQHLDKFRVDNSISSIPTAPLQQKTNKLCEYDSVCDMNRLKTNTIHSTEPQHLKENLASRGGIASDYLAAKELRTNTASGYTSGSDTNSTNRHLCTFCQFSCSKISILRKHISRAHANQKPYSSDATELIIRNNPHYRLINASHSPNEQHDLEVTQSTSSDLELSSCSTATGSDVVQQASRSTTPLGDGYLHSAMQSVTSSVTTPLQDKPYKPKFHTAAFYQSTTNNNNNSTPSSMLDINNTINDDARTVIKISSLRDKPKEDECLLTTQQQLLSTQNVEYLKKHISKIISENEAIMEGVEPALQKKYHKITGISRGGANAQQNAEFPVTTVPTSRHSMDENSKIGLQESTSTNASLDSQKGMMRTLPTTLQQQAQQILKNSNEKIDLAPPPLSPQPLNLTSDSIKESQRKRSLGNEYLGNSSSVLMTSLNIVDASVGSVPTQSIFHENHHPQNPERSIIKSLLLNSRGLAVPTTGEGEDAIYICPLCKIPFRSADNLQYHTKCYCQGTPPQASVQNQTNGSPISNSAPISPVGSPSHKYFRSNSFNLCLPEKYSPNTLAKLASSTLRPRRTPLSLAKLAAQQAAGHHLKASNALGNNLCGGVGEHNESSNNIAGQSTSLDSPFNQPAEVQSVSSQCVQITKQLIDASLPSPGPLLGKTRLVDHYDNVPREITDKSKQSSTVSSLSAKLDATIAVSTENALTLVHRIKDHRSKESLQSLSAATALMNDDRYSPKKPPFLSMCGGDVRIVQKKTECIPRLGSSGGSIVAISSSPSASGPEHSPVSIRAGLHSGGSIIETVAPRRKKSVINMASLQISAGSSTSQTAKYPLTSLSSRSNANQNVMSNFFQFPSPINPITAYNPLTLPTKQPEFNMEVPSTAIEATRIIHGGKIIPFVPGIPGPNSLASNTPISPIVQSERMYDTHQKALPILDHAHAHDTFTPLGLPLSLHQKNLPMQSAKLKMDSTSEETMSFEHVLKIRENDMQVHTESKTKSSPDSIADLARRGENCNHTYSSAMVNGSQNQVAVPYALRPKTTLVRPAWMMNTDDELSKCSNELNDIVQTQLRRTPGMMMDSSAVVANSNYAFDLSSTKIRDRCSNEKPFNFTRMADNLSPPEKKKSETPDLSTMATTDTNLAKVKLKLLAQTYDATQSSLHINVENVEILGPRSEQISSEMESSNLPASLMTKTPKFLRPSSLPLKPGTFTPKKHHGITPTSNTFALISPETPRPSKNCVQLYLNGHAYTYLGLKCSTKPFYCTVNRPQPVHFTNQPKLLKLSSYSNWQTCAENNPHPLGFSPVEVMSLYDSRQRQQQCQNGGSKYTIANRLQYTTLHSQSVKLSQAYDMQPHLDASNRRRIVVDESQRQSIEMISENDRSIIQSSSSMMASSTITTPSSSAQQVLISVYGGYKSNEEYTYVRGRGRGQYVCLKCGIRCRKPSMLKKHIRTHSDDRPYTCRLCKFSFKTKGNLTKHMKSRGHSKKRIEVGIDPEKSIEEDDATTADDTGTVSTSNANSNNITNSIEDTESEESSEDGDDGDSSDNEDAKLPDHEAAHCLLSLSQRSSHGDETTNQSRLVPCQPMTYPYVKNDYKNSPLSQSNMDFLRGQHDNSSSQSDSIISKQSCYSSLSGDTNAATVASTSSDPATMHSENRQKRISAETSDAIDLSKPRDCYGSGNSNGETKYDRFSSDSKIIATTTSSYAGTASLLNSLMMLSEKVRPSTPASLVYDEQHKGTMLYQTYLTERALQNSKMRLSQVAEQPQSTIFEDDRGSSKNANGRDSFSLFGSQQQHIRHTSCSAGGMMRTGRKRERKLSTEYKSGKSTSPSDILTDNNSCEEKVREEASHAAHAAKTTNVQTEENGIQIGMQFPKSSNDDSPIPLNKSNNGDRSSMDTLAEIAANSIKLDASKIVTDSTVRVTFEPQRSMAATISYTQVSPTTNQSISKPSNVQNESAIIGRKEISAKNIASEFLKIANEQDSNYPISNTTTDFDDSQSSSNSDITNESTNKKARRSSLVSSSGHSAHHHEILISARTVVVGEDGFTTKSSNSKDLPMVRMPRGAGTSNTASQAFIQEDNGPVKCEICHQKFSKRSSLLLHMNVHYMNPQNKLRCEPCGQGFSSQSRLQKHLLSDSHRSKVNVIEATGTSTSSSNNPRPFECIDCGKAFRILGHLAKHLRSKSHITCLEHLGKLPTGTFALIEAHINLTKSTEIDTTDCDKSLASFKKLAEKLKSESGSSSYESNSIATNYERSNDDGPNCTESRANDEPLRDVSATKKRRLNEDCKEEASNATINDNNSDDN